MQHLSTYLHYTLYRKNKTYFRLSNFSDIYILQGTVVRWCFQAYFEAWLGGLAKLETRV